MTISVYVVVCANGKPCSRVGEHGSAWEDHESFMVNENEAKGCAFQLDDPSFIGIDGRLDLATCGPHRVIKLVESPSSTPST